MNHALAEVHYKNSEYEYECCIEAMSVTCDDYGWQRVGPSMDCLKEGK